jgi:type IV pilus assembly protein PilB
MKNNDDNVSFLEGQELFHGFSGQELNELAQELKTVIYPPGAIVMREGTPGEALFFVKTGQALIKKRESSLGVDLTIATLGPGTCFGEMALLTDKPRSATVQAADEPLEVLVLQRDAFTLFLQQNPRLSITLNRILAERLDDINAAKGINFISLSNVQPESEVASLLPPQLLQKYKVVPVAASRGTLLLAMTNPRDLPALDDVKRFLRGFVTIEPVAISEDDFRHFMQTTSSRTKEPVDTSPVETHIDGPLMDVAPDDLWKDIAGGDSGGGGNDDGDGDGDSTVSDLEREASDAPIIRLVNTIITTALKNGASDIHIEPREKGLSVRYRIDGVLHNGQGLPRRAHLPLVSRIKILSRLDITERRLPQDGRITVRLEGRAIDFRVSTIPAKFGEKVVIRILDKGRKSLSLDRFITDEVTLRLVREIIRKPYGIVYVTGPTGSGKTTTLYSALAELNRHEVNISTVEDPIEYDLEGVNQVQVNPDIGLDFSRVLRAFLRQDPDIILIGETRDKETARIAIEAALTGHLVFTTVHANDAPSTCVRLVEMGIEPFLMATSMLGVVAQRLVRRVCESCAEGYTADAETLDYLGLEHGTTLYRGAGCANCNYTGYRNRVAIFEVMLITEELRHLIAAGADAQRVKEEAVRSGMKTLREYACDLLRGGLTTVDEVLRAVVIQQ